MNDKTNAQAHVAQQHEKARQLGESNSTDLLCVLTREGNQIILSDDIIRNSIRGNSKSLCADCVNVNDLCQYLWKQSSNFNGYNEITKCEGFEDVCNVC